MDGNEILNVAGMAGRILLESGAEAYRTEETMVKICEGFGMEDAQSYVTTTGIMMSITHEKKNYAKITRIQRRGVDLNKIDLINALSRNICAKGYTIAQVEEELHRIDEMGRYAYFTTLFFSALSAFGFAFFFHGTWKDAICAFVIGLAIKFVSLGMEKSGINLFFHNALAAGVGGLLAVGSIKVGWADSLDTVIISSIMLLVPGLAITNAIRDSVAGDYVTGLSRAVEAFLCAIAIAVGIVAVLTLWGGQ